MSRKRLICAMSVSLLAVAAWEVYACEPPPPPPPPPPPQLDPIARINGSETPEPVYTCTNKTVIFGGSGSEDPDGGPITNYKWEFPASAYEVSMTSRCVANPDCYCTSCGSNCLHGSNCTEVSCKFSSTGPHTVRLTVTDDEGATDLCECTVYVANVTVTSVVWETYPDDVVASPVDHGPNIDIEEYPASSGNWRIFPGKKCHDDTSNEGSMRRKVKVKATVSPVYPGMPVYFRSWDVDDPSANDAGLPEAQCTWPVDCDELNHSHYTGYMDNRCNYCYTFENGAPVPHCKTEYVASGSDEVEATISAVSMQPGDNARVTATTGYFANPSYITWEMVNSGTGLPAEIKRSPILTTWRKLHVEQDSMKTVATTGSEKNYVEGTAATYDPYTPPPWNTTKVHLGIDLPDAFDDDNQFKDGRYVVAGFSPYTVRISGLDDPGDWIKVEGDPVGDGVPVPTAYKLYDDDDDNLPSYPSLGNWADKFKEAYIEMDYLMDVRDEVTFIRNLSTDSIAWGTGDWNNSHNRLPSEDFWTVFICTAFQPQSTKDGDGYDNWRTYGATRYGAIGGWKNQCVIYLEVTETEGAPFGVTIGGTMAHEIGHTGGPDDNKCEEGCIMWSDLNGVPGDHFCNKCLHDFRKDEEW